MSRPMFGTGDPEDASSLEWLAAGEHGDVVLSSRVRLARNLAGFKFVHKCTRPERLAVLDAARSWLLNAELCERVMWIDLHESPKLERDLLVERHLISKQHAKGKPSGATPESKPGAPAEDPRGVAVSLPTERLSIMVNEEDHLRIQVVRGGLALEDAWNEIDKVDDKIEAGLDYAFSPTFGYITACPTNVGTGLRMSVMLHLPALRMTGELEKVKRAAEDMNLAVRGFYGEGSDALGDLFQVSNQTTLGKTERTVLTDLAQEIIPQVIEYERIARRGLLAKRMRLLEDQVFRALGTLLHARMISAEEAMTQLSLLRLGVCLGMITHIPIQKVNHLMLLVQPAHVQRLAGKELDQEHRKVERATILRRRLGQEPPKPTKPA